MMKDQVMLSNITIFNKYAKYIPELKRRETWEEICYRYKNMMISRYPKLGNEINENIKYVVDKKVLPSMRAMQFAGPAISKNESRIYNCAYAPVDSIDMFSEAMFLLLGGTGLGYSVQFAHIDKLPEIRKPNKEKKFVISDSLEGWADAIKVLIKAYFGQTEYKPKFNYSDIRHKGERLKTAGGKAPGPRPLMECIGKIEALLASKDNGDKLKSIEVHSIMCYIADAVLSGGIRRSAMIALFSFDDEEMLKCKHGNWWELNPQFGRANNSAVILRSRIEEDEFTDLWERIKLSNSGEPGMYYTNNTNWGTNPCCEIALRPYQFCNLSEINVSDIDSQEELNKRSKIASFFGTLQAGFTDFHYLRPIWKKTTEKEALIGVGMTGIASGKVLTLDLKEAALYVKKENSIVSAIIDINEAARCTTIKPSGTTSCVLSCSSGIHGWHSNYYIRRLRLMKNDSLYTYLLKTNPELLEDDKLVYNTAILSIPQKAPEGSILRTESPLTLLERVRKFNLEWVKNGHRKGDNTNNVSATISIKDNEWSEVGNWMWANKSTFNGLSVLPYDSGSYIQAPFEECTKEEYERLSSLVKNINLQDVSEEDDNTEHSQEAACAGGQCEV